MVATTERVSRLHDPDTHSWQDARGLAFVRVNVEVDLVVGRAQRTYTSVEQRDLDRIPQGPYLVRHLAQCRKQALKHVSAPLMALEAQGALRRLVNTATDW
jgi:hypothetical protein